MTKRRAILNKRNKNGGKRSEEEICRLTSPCDIKKNFEVDFSIPLKDFDLLPHQERRRNKSEDHVVKRNFIPRAAKTRSKIKSLNNSVIIISDSSDEEDPEIQDVSSDKNNETKPSVSRDKTIIIGSISFKEENFTKQEQLPASDESSKVIDTGRPSGIIKEPILTVSIGSKGETCTKQKQFLIHSTASIEYSTVRSEEETKESVSDPAFTESMNDCYNGTKSGLNIEPNPAYCEATNPPTDYHAQRNTHHSKRNEKGRIMVEAFYKEKNSDLFKSNIYGSNESTEFAESNLDKSDPIIAPSHHLDMNSRVEKEINCNSKGSTSFFNERQDSSQGEESKPDPNITSLLDGEIPDFNGCESVRHHESEHGAFSNLDCAKFEDDVYDVPGNVVNNMEFFKIKECLLKRKIKCIKSFKNSLVSRTRRCYRCFKFIKSPTFNRHLLNHYAAISQKRISRKLKMKAPYKNRYTAPIIKDNETGKKDPGKKRIWGQHCRLKTKLNRFSQNKAECHVCGKLLKNEYYLKRHMHVHTNIVFKCQFCPNVYKWRKDLNQHVKMKHSRRKNDKSSTRTKSQGKLNQCIILPDSHNFKQKKLSKAKPTTRNSLNIDKIKLTSLNTENTAACAVSDNVGCNKKDRRLCPECKEMIPDVMYASHLITHEKKTKTKCDICGTFVIHIKSHLDTHKETIYNCSICQRSYKSLKGLMKHMKIKHKDSDRTIDCLVNKRRHQSRKYDEAPRSDQHNDIISTENSMSGELSSVDKNKDGRTNNGLGSSDEGTAQDCMSRNPSIDHTDKDPKDIKSRRLEKKNIVTNSKKNYKCNVCDKKFTKTTNLKNHMVTHQKDRSHSCMYCPSKYKCKYTLFRHIDKMHHNELSKSRGQRNISDLPESSQKYKCETCGLFFEAEIHMVYHKKKVHRGPKYPCPIGLCTEVYHRKKLLRVHINWHKRQDVALSSVCPYCGRSYANHNSLQHHLRYSCIHKVITPERVPCKICGKVLSKAAMLQHVKRIHKNLVVREACTICGKYVGKTNLPLHMKSHEDPQYRCGECGKLFTLKHQLNNHMLSHGDERKFVCTYCPLKFKMAHHLRSHLKTQHMKQ